MCVALVGGMDRLQPDYTRTAKQLGVKLKCFTGKEKNIRTQIGNADAIIILTNKCSHKARVEAQQRAKSGDIPVLCMHTAGVSSLRNCLGGLAKGGPIVQGR